MLKFFKYSFFIFTLLFFINGNALETDWVGGSESQVRIISPIANNNNQNQITLGLEFYLSEGWKTYWKSPGDGGFSQEINWSNSENIKSLDIMWPVPKHFEILGIKSIGYSDKVIFPFKINLKDSNKKTLVVLDINYLICKDICIPANANLELLVSPGKENLTDHTFILEKAISELPQNSLEFSFLKYTSINFYRYNDLISVEFFAEAKKNFIKPSIFLHTKYGLPVNKPITKLSANGKNFEAKFNFNSDLINDTEINAEIVIVDNNQSYVLNEIITIDEKKIIRSYNYLLILIIAFIGGLILNCMPCVLPILSIKLLAILQYSNNKSSVRKSFLLTSLGIVSSFFLLAIIFILLRHLGYNIGWGIQFQEPYFLMFISVVLILFSLNLFGIFEFSIPKILNFSLINSLQSKNNTKDFFNGFFATLMATPCSAPFVGTALTFAFTQSYFSMLYIFISMGLGMAFPYLFISIFPQLLRFLPKPGIWMLYLKYLLGLLLLGTLIWINNILLSHFNYYFIISSLVLLLVVLILNYFSYYKKTFSIISILIFFILPNFTFFASTFNKFDSNWMDFNNVDIKNLIQNDHIVFVDVTADWCATCQFNKINVLNNILVKEAFEKLNIIKVKADWTKPNENIQKYLQKNNKFGIPFNIIYDRNNPNGIEFSELLSLKEMLSTLENIKSK